MKRILSPPGCGESCANPVSDKSDVRNDERDISVSSDSADVLSGAHALLSIYLEDLRRCRIIKKNEYQELYSRIDAGDQTAFDEVLVNNLRLVVSVSKTYRAGKQTILDRISHGIIGLYSAVRKFRPELGFSFSTYAISWIKQAIDRGIASELKLVRLPHHVYMKNNRYLRILHEREGRGLAPLTDDELKSELGFTADSQLNRFKNIHRAEYSIDAPVQDSECTMGETLVSENEVVVSEKADSASNKAVLFKIMNDSLNYREKLVLQMYYIREMSLEDIGGVLGLTTEGVRVVRNGALKRVKSKMHVHGLVFSDFM